VNDPRGVPLLERPDQIVTIDGARGGEPLDLELVLESSSAGDAPTLDPVGYPADLPIPTCSVGPRGAQPSAPAALLLSVLLAGA
jgi:hypothetical protein